MNSTALQVHKWWLKRAVLVLLLTALADAAAVWFTRRPLLWSALIGSSLSLSMIVFVAIPLLRQEGRKSQSSIDRTN